MDPNHGSTSATERWELAPLPGTNFLLEEFGVPSVKSLVPSLRERQLNREGLFTSCSKGSSEGGSPVVQGKPDSPLQTFRPRERQAVLQSCQAHLDVCRKASLLSSQLPG